MALRSREAVELMRLAIISFSGFFSSCYRRLAGRMIFSLLIAAAATLSSLLCGQTSRVAFAQTSSEMFANLNLIVRDSMTGQAVRSEVASNNKNGPMTFSANADGARSYRLSSGRNDLDVHAVGYKDLSTHFEADSQSVKNVTVWVDPLQSP